MLRLSSHRVPEAVRCLGMWLSHLLGLACVHGPCECKDHLLVVLSKPHSHLLSCPLLAAVEKDIVG